VEEALRPAPRERMDQYRREATRARARVERVASIAGMGLPAAEARPPAAHPQLAERQGKVARPDSVERPDSAGRLEALAPPHLAARPRKVERPVKVGQPDSVARPDSAA